MARDARQTGRKNVERASRGWAPLMLGGCLLLGGVCLAQGNSETSVTLKVGQTKKVPVGFAHGLICDDLSVVSAELKTATPTQNVLVLTGAHEGSTVCRAGTDRGGPHVTVTVKVVAKAPAP